MHAVSTITRARREALAERLGSIARLSLGVTHDMNNVLGAINSNVGMMRRKLPEEPSLHQSLRHIAHASEHASQLTQTLSIYTQHQTQHLHSFYLQQQLAPLIKTFASSLPAEVSLHDEKSHSDTQILSCPLMFQHAVTGIFQNAADSLPCSRGRIDIETGRIDGSIEHQEKGLFFGTMPTGAATVLEVRDNGTGMEEAVLEHILEPFFSTRIRGRGLGLAPVVGLVFHCNAAIHILSIPAKGTRFRLLLPAAG